MKKLVYHKGAEALELPLAWQGTSSTLECYHLSRQDGCSMVAVSFVGLTPEEAEDALLLCGYLTQASSPPGEVLPIVDIPTPRMLDRLADCGVTALCLARRAEAIPSLLASERSESIASVLERTCPLLSARLVTGCQLLVCEGYRGRMVLGGTRLDRLCLGGDYKECSIWNSPKIGPSGQES